MKHTRQILIALVVVMTLLMTLAVIPASAATTEETITVYFKNDWNWSKVSCHYWGGSSESTWPGVEMTDTGDTSGAYHVFSAEIPADTTGIVFNGIAGGANQKTRNITTNIADGSAWTISWDETNDDADGNVQVDDAVYIESLSYDDPNAGTFYSIAGTSLLCGANWDPTNTATDMTLNADGLYEITLESVPAGDHEFKVVKNHAWAESWGVNGGNYTLTTTAVCDITIKFNADTKAITVTTVETGEVIDISQNKYTVVGGHKTDGQSVGKLGTWWDPTNTDNDMVYDEETKTFVKVYEEWPEGEYQLKVVKDHKWGIEFGGDGENGNYDFEVTVEGSTVTVTFDGTSVKVAIEAPHVHDHTTPATCTENSICSCGYENPNTALGHDHEACTHVLVKANNLAGWNKVYCYYWKDTVNNGWPGEEMTLGDDGNYYFYLPEGTSNVIFTNGDKNDTIKTGDLLVEAGKTHDINVSISGSMNNWTPAVMEFANGVTTIKFTLAAGTYEFKIINGVVWLGNSETISDKTDASGVEMISGDSVGNCKLVAKGGIYTFIFNANTKNLIVEWECTHSDVDTDDNHDCDICDAKDVTSHSYTASVTAPTCTDEGYTTNTCNCGHSYPSDEVAATGHSKSTTTVAPTCVAEGYDLTTCANCPLEETSNFVSATGNHTYVDFACSVCSAAMPAVESDGGKKVYDFNTEDGFTAIQADAYIALSGKFRLNDGGCYQMYPADEEKGTPASKIQLVVPAHRSVTIEGHSAGYGKLYVKINDEIKEITTGSLTFETSEETKVEITAVNDSNSYIKSITVEIPKIISTDANLTFHEGGTYNDYGIDFSGININNAGRTDNAQVKEGSFTFNVKAGAVVTILSYHDSSLVSYKINGGEEINAEKYYIYAVTDSTITYTPVNNNNYLVSIDIKFHEGLKLVSAVAATCTAGGNEAYYDCDCCEGTLTEKVELDALGHDEISHEAKAPTCSAIGWDAYVTCSRCDYTTYVEKAALGHSWVDATCTAPKTCSVCSMTDGAAAGHSWVDATCTAPKTCSKCSATEGEALGHAWDDGVVTTQPTCAVEGVKTFSCANCDETKTEKVATVAHKYDTYKSICEVCYAANPDFIKSTIVVGETNTVKCNKYNFVGDLGPYEFLTVNISEAGHYKFVGEGLLFTIYTISTETEGADFTAGTGASWKTWVLTEADLQPGTYWIGIVFTGGEGEYTVTVEQSAIVPPHTHNFVEGKCECGESDPNYIPPVEEKPVDPQPEPQPELNFFQKIWQAILAFFQKILGMFKK